MSLLKLCSNYNIHTTCVFLLIASKYCEPIYNRKYMKKLEAVFRRSAFHGNKNHLKEPDNAFLGAQTNMQPNSF